MRSAKGGANESASTTNQDRRNHARMWILVSFGSHGSAKAKADDGSDQSMAPVPWLPPHSAMAPPVIAPSARQGTRDQQKGGK
ncbi:MAG: hypothetical protein WB762_06235 [Candidatus Sulfotelmatobacter sp.]